MKKKFLMMISLILVMLSVLGACNSGKEGEETTAAVESNTGEDAANADAPLLVNDISITEYTVVYDARVSIGSDAAMKYFKSKLNQQYKIEIEPETREVDGYQILIGVAGTDSSINEFFSTCEEGMIGFDGKNIYLLSKDNQGIYSVVDAFFAKAVESEGRSYISISQNEKVAMTKDEITVMSYNVLYDLSAEQYRDLPALANLIKEQSPDVFGTQEALDAHKTAILEAMPNYQCYTGVKLKGGAGMSNMIFWNTDKFKAIEKGFQYLTDTPYIESKIPESNSYRGFSYVILESLATGKQFMFIDVHLTYRNADGDTNDDGTRLKQAKYLIKFLENKKYETMPIILVGDFNSVPSSQTLTAVENVKRFDRTAWVAKNKGDLGGTTTRAVRTIRDTYEFDHIFVTSDRISTQYFSAIDKKVDGRYPADHLPVIAKIAIY